MPIYEYRGVHYDLADTDPAAAKAKILQHLAETNVTPEWQQFRKDVTESPYISDPEKKAVLRDAAAQGLTAPKAKFGPPQTAQAPVEAPPVTSPMGEDFGSAIMAAATPKKESVLEGTVAQRPIHPEEAPLRQEFIRGVEAQLNALPAAQRNAKLAQLAARPDVYGRAARIIQDKYAKLDAIQSKPLRQATDPRLETQVERYIERSGASPETAQMVAMQNAMRGVIGRDLPQARGLTPEEEAAEEYRFRPGMTTAEQLALTGKRVAERIPKSYMQMGAGVIDFLGDVTGIDVSETRSKGRSLEAYLGAMGTNPNEVLKPFEGAAVSIATQLPALMTGNMPLIYGNMFLQSFGQSYSDAKRAGLDPVNATAKSALDGALELIGERFGMSQTIAGLKATAKGDINEAIKYYAKALAREIPGEQITYTGQTATGQLYKTDPEITIERFLRGAVDTATTTVAQAGMMMGGSAAAAKAIRKLDERALGKELVAKDFKQSAIDEYVRRSLSPEFYDDRTVIPGVRAVTGVPETKGPLPPKPEELGLPPVAEEEEAPAPTPAPTAAPAKTATQVLDALPGGGFPVDATVEDRKLSKQMIDKIVTDGIANNKTNEQILEQVNNITNNTLTTRAVTELDGLITRSRPTAPAAPAPAPTAPTAEQKRRTFERLVQMGVDEADAAAMVEKQGLTQLGQAPQTRLATVTQEYVDAGYTPEDARQLALAQVQKEAEADAGISTETAATGEGRATKPVSEPSGAGVGVAGEPGAGAPTKRPARTKRTGVAPAGQDVAESDAGEGKPSAPVAQDIKDEIQKAANSPKGVGYKTTGDGRVTAGASLDATRHVELDLTPEEKKAFKRAEALLELAETPEERTEAKQAIQAALRPAVDRATAPTAKGVSVGTETTEAVQTKAKRQKAPAAVKAPDLPDEAPQALKDVASGTKAVAPAKVVAAKPGDIPAATKVGKPRGRPAKVRTPEEAAKAKEERKQQTIAANQARRQVNAAVKKLTDALLPTPKGAKGDGQEMRRQEAARNRATAIRELYAISRQNKNKPGKDAAEALKNPKITADELEAAKADYERNKAAKAQDLLPAKEEITTKPGADVGRLTKLLGSKLYGTPQDIGRVTIKELFQNAFDAIKGSLDNKRISAGNIQIKTNEQDRTIQIIDNGPGMPTSVMGNQFLQIAGTLKESERASGGLGIAKMLFLFENKQLTVISLRDGVLSHMETTGDELKRAMDDPSAAPKIQVSKDPATIKPYKETLFPDGHGTFISVQIPESYVDPASGETKEISFSNYSLKTAPVLRFSPLLDPITVTLTRTSDAGYTFTPDVLPIGDNFPVKNYTPFANINFAWGTARILVSKKPEKQYDENLHVLSNGLWQFSNSLQDKPGWDGKKLPRVFYVDVSPQVKADDPGYPFDLNRQRFTAAAQKDFDKIYNYLTVLFRQESFADEVKSYGTVQYFKPNGTLSDPETLTPKVPKSETPLTAISPDDDVEVRDGVLYVNNRPLPEISQKDIETTALRVDELTIPQDDVRSDWVMLHDNTQIPGEGNKSLTEVARDRFGKEFDSYARGVGKIFMELRNALIDADPSTYSGLIDEVIGVSFDKSYYGVSIKVPFRGFFINPGTTDLSDTVAEVASSLLGTMQHELAHYRQRGHDASFVSEFQRIQNLLENRSPINMGYIKDRLTAHITDHLAVFNFLNKEFKDGNIEPRARVFQDASYQRRGDEGAAEPTEGAGDTGGRAEQRVRTSTGQGTAPTQPVGVGAGVSGQAGAGGASPVAARTAAQLDKEVNKAIDGFEKSATATDVAEGVSLLSSLRDIDKLLPYFRGLYEKLDGTRLSTVMFFMTNDSLAAWGSSYIPELDNTNKQLRLMRTMARNLLGGAQDLSNEINRAIVADPPLKRQLEKVMSVSTDVRVDPSVSNANAKLSKLYDDLSPKGKELYGKVRDYYATLVEYYEQLLDEQIAAANMPAKARDVVMAEIRKLYETDKRIVPFFPFVRNRGEFWLQVDKGEGRQFYTFKNEVERQAVMQHIATSRNKTVQQMLEDEDFRKGDTLEGFRKATSDLTVSLKKVFNEIDNSVDAKEIVGRVAELTNVIKKNDPTLPDDAVRIQAYAQAKDEVTRDIKNAIYELYLMTLPDQSFRRGFIERKDIPGYNVDLLRNFSTHAIKTSSQLPRIKFGPALRRSLMASEKSLKGNPESSKLMRFVNEMERRVDLELNPYPAPPAGIPPKLSKALGQTTDFATRMAFVHYLSAAGSALIQSTGLLYGASTLGARHGYVQTAIEMGKMLRVWNEFGMQQENSDGSVTWRVPSIVHSRAVATTPDEKRAIRMMMGAGIGEYTLTSEMLNRGRVSTAAFESRGSALGRGAMMVLGGPFQTIERLTQESLFLPAYRLNRAKGIKKGLAGQELFDYAVDHAVADVFDSVGNMAESNRPPILRNAGGRLLLQFMMYPLFITSRWMREAYRIVMAHGIEARYQAFKEFAGIMGVTWMLAGVAGLPFFSTILGYMAAWFEDEDKKMGRKTLKDLDYWTWWRTVWLPEYMGKVGIFGRPLTEVVGMNKNELAALIERGPTNMLTGADISSRTSINPTDMFSGQNKEVRTTKEGALQFAEDRAGPFVGMVLSYMDAYDAFGDGDIQRGMEKMLPAIARNPVVAFKYYKEGVKDFRGATILKQDSMTTGRLIYQAVGLRLDEVANQQKFLFQLAKVENKIRFEREDILKNMRDAHVKNDFDRYYKWRKESVEFNRKYPSFAIDDKAIERSIESGRERAATAVRGLVPTEENLPIFKESMLNRAEAMREFEQKTKK